MFSPKRRFKYRRLVPPGGSISFSQASLNVANADGYLDITSGTPFTVEWFQYALSGNPANVRAFSIGNYNTATFAFSEEGNGTAPRKFYVWRPGGFVEVGSLAEASFVNQWIHFALVGDGSTIQVYQDGAKLGPTASYTSITSTKTLAIGNETNNLNASAFSGYITNFRWVTGTAVYTNTFSRPSQPLTAIPGTRLLFSATDSASAFTDSSPAARATTTAGTISWVSNTPFA